jgi:hypothetical protein
MIEKIVMSANNSERQWDVFTYNGKYLKQITTSNKEINDVRKIRTIKSIENGNIIDLEIKNFIKGTIDFTENWIFSNYDEYGNWHNAERHLSSGFSETLVREIDYY